MREEPSEITRPSWSRGRFARYCGKSRRRGEDGPTEGEGRPAVGVDHTDAREGLAVDEEPHGSDSDWEPARGTPEEDLCNEMFRLYIKRTLNARQCCRTMWFAGRAGNISADVYGYDPHCKHSNHFKRHLNQVMTGLVKVRGMLYGFDMPGSSSNAVGRATQRMHAFVPHDKLDVWPRDFAGYVLQLRGAMGDGISPPRYYQHPVVRDSQPDDYIAVVNLFVDVVEYSNNATCIGVRAI